MADTPQQRAPMGQPAHTAPETSVGRQSHVGVELGIPLEHGQTAAPVHREPDHGLEVNIEGTDASLTRVDSSAEPKAVKLDADGKPIPAEVAATEETTQEGAAPAALPDFDAAKPETVEAYDKAFLGADGKSFNMAALSADWAKNATMDAKTGDFSGGLSEGTMKFLESRGIDRETVKSVEAGQVARIKLDRQEVFTQAGGAEKYNAAIEWARTGGYDAAGAAKFNTDLNAGGAARKDAVDLLMQRFSKANPARRAVTPARTTANAAAPAGGPQGGAQPYTNYQEYQADLRKARQTNDQALLNATRARLKVSPWHSGQK